MICGEAHLPHLVTEFVAHYNLERPHQVISNTPLPEADHSADEPPILKLPSGEVRRRSRLSGLPNHYYSAAV